MRILVVDDEIMQRILLQELLELLGHQVVGDAENGAKALELYASLKPDVVTLDISLPDMDGLQVLRQLREMDPKARVVMISGNDQEVIIQKALAAGALELLVKPLDKTRLEALLSELQGLP